MFRNFWSGLPFLPTYKHCPKRFEQCTDRAMPLSHLMIPIKLLYSCLDAINSKTYYVQRRKVTPNAGQNLLNISLWGQNISEIAFQLLTSPSSYCYNYSCEYFQKKTESMGLLTIVLVGKRVIFQSDYNCSQYYLSRLFLTICF